MRKVLSLALFFVLLSAIPAFSADVKIAVFNLQTVARECDALKEAQKVLDETFGKEKNALEKDRLAIETKMKDLKPNATPAQKAEIEKLQAAYGEKAGLYVRKVQEAEMRVRTDIDTVIIEASKALAQKNGYTIILDSPTAAVYADPSLDVTKDMITEANTWWKNSKTK